MFQFKQISNFILKNRLKNRILHFLLSSFIFLLSPAAAEISVHSQVDKSEITIGDQVTYQIAVQYPDSGSLELPSILGNLGSFEVKEFNVSEPVEIKSGREKVWKLIISTFTVGPYTLPPQLIEYTPPNDTNKTVLHTEPIQIMVNRTTPETVKDIADITGLVLRGKGMRDLYIALTVLLGIAASLGAWLYIRYRKMAGSKIPTPLPPYEEALKALERLRLAGLADNGRWKEYCFSLSEILRRYITRRFAIDALESTTEEFLGKIQTIDLTKAQRDIISQFCETTDPVKFADQPLTSDEGEEVYHHVKNIADQTRPREISPEIKAKSQLGEKEKA